jgi:hypothetical protein
VYLYAPAMFEGKATLWLIDGKRARDFERAMIPYA